MIPETIAFIIVINYSQFYYPCSLLPTPCSLLPKTHDIPLNSYAYSTLPILCLNQ
ncbi:hypothetical protein BJP36_43355 [Moorena producens JHB]|uniref:Uncharacterized protein n=1 Tax=Moorena producens (strain JHB) TaxID=1454205 RepID=A0A9Q9UVU5_MOOP1|nr:hypothetical protein [Moorena producens]WAN69201.1 hypothetical protein BJP36_43355 [Moorena producens JHB]